MQRSWGLTLIEALIILAIIGIIAGLATVYGARALRAQQERAAIASLQQIVWRGATAAASRNARTELRRDGRTLELVNLETDRVLKRMTLLDDVDTNLPEGVMLTFLPPGKVELSSLRSFGTREIEMPDETTYRLSVSVIGEVTAETTP